MVCLPACVIFIGKNDAMAAIDVVHARVAASIEVFSTSFARVDSIFFDSRVHTGMQGNVNYMYMPHLISVKPKVEWEISLCTLLNSNGKSPFAPS